MDHLLIDVVDLAKKSLVSYIELHPWTRTLVAPSHDVIPKVDHPARAPAAHLPSPAMTAAFSPPRRFKSPLPSSCCTCVRATLEFSAIYLGLSSVDGACCNLRRAQYAAVVSLAGMRPSP